MTLQFQLDKQIRDVGRGIMKVFYTLDDQTIDAGLLRADKWQQFHQELMAAIEAGAVGEAEDRLFEIMTFKDPETLHVALLFYNALNTKDDDFLKKVDFPREEVQSGLQDVYRFFHLKELFEMIMMQAKQD